MLLMAAINKRAVGNGPPFRSVANPGYGLGRLVELGFRVSYHLYTTVSLSSMLLI